MGGAGIDSALVTNAQGAQAAGIEVAYYHFFRPDSTGNAQANNFLHATAGKGKPFWYAVDVETPFDKPDAGISKDEYAARLAEFVRTMQAQTGELPVIYTSQGEWSKLVGTVEDALFSQCRLWVANYTSALKPALPRCWTDWLLWQHTSEHAVTWTQNKRVDANRWKTAQADYIAPADFPYVISSRFNDPRTYAFAPTRKQLHEGTDFAPTNTAVAPYRVVAPRAGVVDKVGFDKRGYGNYIRIDHGDGWYSWLAHLSNPPLVTSGRVEQGALVGYAGSTGATSTGIHLHWTLQHVPDGEDNYVVEDVVDPEQYLKVS